mmetsp:Transcript_20142/g.58451  ORF Transcript_20142/g.58451 Transcript_20142/m.58451 type:complete len:283 (-) Transcript_20142:193-1041(-)
MATGDAGNSIGMNTSLPSSIAGKLDCGFLSETAGSGKTCGTCRSHGNSSRLGAMPMSDSQPSAASGVRIDAFCGMPGLRSNSNADESVAPDDAALRGELQDASAGECVDAADEDTSTAGAHSHTVSMGFGAPRFTSSCPSAADTVLTPTEDSAALRLSDIASPAPTASSLRTPELIASATSEGGTSACLEIDSLGAISARAAAGDISRQFGSATSTIAALPTEVALPTLLGNCPPTLSPAPAAFGLAHTFASRDFHNRAASPTALEACWAWERTAAGRLPAQ